MKSRLSSVIFMLFCAVFAGCSEEIEQIHELEKQQQPDGFRELVEAYLADRVFVSAVHDDSKCVISFQDGYTLTVQETSFKVYDCTVYNPMSVCMIGTWWCVGNVSSGIRVENCADIDALPVYVYFDSVTLHAYLSNGAMISFKGSPREDNPDDDQEVVKKNIPIVYITTAGGAGIYDKKNYVDGTITVCDPDKMYSEVTEFKADMGIRGRGNSTWGWPKKPWKVKLDSKASLLGMPADKEWVLLANYSDRTLLRNLVAMELSSICGFSWTPRMHSVEVYLNGDYQGVYTLGEHKKVSSDRVNISVVGENDNESPAVEGGYYLELEENQDETTCWWTDMGVPMMFSDPEVPTDAQYRYMTGYIRDFETVLRSSGFADPVTGYSAYIDMKSFIDFYIVQELTKNIDGNLRKSSFITKEQGKKMEMYHLWDFDLTLGNCGYFDWRVGNGPEGFWIKDYASNSTPGGGWYYYLFKDPAFVDAVQARWNELLPQLRTIPDFIDEQAELIAPARERNFEKWSIYESVDWVNFPSLGSYEKELNYLKTFYSERLEWLDRELNLL